MITIEGNWKRITENAPADFLGEMAGMNAHAHVAALEAIHANKIEAPVPGCEVEVRGVEPRIYAGRC